MSELTGNAIEVLALTRFGARVLDSRFERSDYIPLDLSVNNSDLQNFDVSNAASIQSYIDQILSSKNGRVAYGGYLETRGIYRRSDHFADPNKEERNIHLGLDLWCPSGTAILACLPGIIHSFRDNCAFGDYGPTIILEHEINGNKFHTLYGHLSRSSLVGLEEGAQVDQGQQIAELGEPSENGDYAPHLHFQIIIDLQGKKGDYPGVCAASELDFFLYNCPDPNIILQLS